LFSPLHCTIIENDCIIAQTQVALARERNSNDQVEFAKAATSSKAETAQARAELAALKDNYDSMVAASNKKQLFWDKERTRLQSEVRGCR
jgi:hypothetical protein